jgi:probable rRNA maturation factor
MKPNKVAVLAEDARWRGHGAAVRRAAQAALTHERAQGGINVMLADDAAVRSLNRDYRAKDKPTNVLSFPDGEHGHLGDVILAYETIAREAEQQGKTLRDHLAHLVVHGVLHVLGYDHEQGEAEAEAMEAREITILAGLGIDNPYEER